eukprot:TRINITY_DN45319_c0_g1_i1.p1 TRINITY_DN45319_c0_g1~~TRINITY_DN45319_c0_g1_i1.p1  ORF type:complete len:574 (+),score=159.10 TRINITY_DN45319_c0_g1_i1:88-1722(+)
MASKVLLACALSTAALMMSPAGATANLRRSAQGTHRVLAADLSKDFLGEIEQVLGSDHRGATEKRLAPMEVMLRPTLASMPKNEHGRYAHKAVKYALHRLFVKRHGWYVNGLESNATTDPSATKIFVDKVPEHLQNLFEARLGSHGLSSHEVALLAAVLENLVHREVVERLRQAYSKAGVDVNATVDYLKADDLLDTYIALYLIDDMREADQADIFKNAEETFPLWKEVKTFVREVRDDRFGEQEKFSFNQVADVVERIADRYGRFQNQDCRELKKSLLAIHNDGSGLIPLHKFYGVALQGAWQFSESREYLRITGALDESLPENPKVIIPNYVLGESNCVGSSSFYSQCCINECEDLLEHLEREVQEPEATPERLAELIRKLPSSSVAANRTLQPQLLKRLNEIAAGFGGRVPLHGRLFAQWMHHAYPIECPFPHSPTTEVLKGQEITLATPEDMQRYVTITQEMEQKGLVRTHHEHGETSQWDGTEVHYAERTNKKRSIWRLLAFAVASISVMRLIFTNLKTMFRDGAPLLPVVEVGKQKNQ